LTPVAVRPMGGTLPHRRKNAIMAVVVRPSRGLPRASDVAGVITREHVANSVAESIRIYPR